VVGGGGGGGGFCDLQADDCVKSDRSGSVRWHFNPLRRNYLKIGQCFFISYILKTSEMFWW